jgi:hypothetical protein
VLDGRAELRLALPRDAFVDTEVAAAKIHEAEAALHAEDWVRGVAAATIAYTISGRGFLAEEDHPVGRRAAPLARGRPPAGARMRWRRKPRHRRV